ncbi:MAG: zinc-ribbon domain-containing protein, partial [Nitrospinota bacterium]
MGCPRCGRENRPGRKFCTGCGADLRAVCPSCGSQIQPGDTFCGECGKPLAQPAVLKTPPSETELAVPPPDQPTSFAGGRYEVRKFLGEG